LNIERWEQESVSVMDALMAFSSTGPLLLLFAGDGWPFDYAWYPLARVC